MTGLLLAALVYWLNPLLLAQAPGAPAAGEAAAQEEESDFHSLYYSAHLPMDRQLSQDLQQAERLLAEGRYSEGLPLVDRVLAASEDSFDARSVRDLQSEPRSLKSEARRLLSELPPEGLAAVELATGVTARRRLDEALGKGDLAAVAEVAARYPFTKSALQAEAMLAQSHQEAGRFDTAARLYEQVAQSPATETSSQLILRLKAAICWSEAGHVKALDQALATLQEAYQGLDKTRLSELVGGDYEKWVNQLKDRVETAVGNSDKLHRQWPHEGGNLARNPVVSVNVPHAWSTWQARTVPDVSRADRLLAREHDVHQEGQTWFLTASPIAVGDLVMVRTPRNVVAFDWESGRRIWETRSADSVDPEHTLNINEPVRDRPRSLSLDPVEQRIWIDSIYASLSADGRRAYAITDLAPPNNDNSSWRAQFFWGAEEEAVDAQGNTLCAYELESEGKLVWQLNGGALRGDLAGAFFLGTPLAVGDCLYVMAEIQNAIHLLCLQPETGALVWKQPLVNMERSVGRDPGRRLAGATPTYAEGLLICPTGAGSIIAVDVVDRSLRWVHRFAVEKSATQEARNWQNRTLGAYQARLSNRWTRARVVVHQGNAVVTTPESDELHCFNLRSGEHLWQASRGNCRFVVGAVGDQVMVASNKEVVSHDLTSGKLLWTVDLSKTSAETVITGLGLVDRDRVIIPLSLGRVAVIDPVKGELTQTVSLRPGDMLGNLAYHRGSLLSQTSTGISRYDQRDLLAAQADEHLNVGSEDPRALRIKGELAWSDGKLSEAIGLFQRAYEAGPDDPLIAQRLSEALLEGLRHDYSQFQDRSELLARLVTDTPQRMELARIHVEGALESGDLKEAWRQALKLYEMDREGPIPLARDHLTVADRWFAGRVDRLWREGNASLRAAMVNDVARLHGALVEAGDMAPLAKLVRYFGATPAGAPARVHLAKKYLDQQRLAEAEVILLRAPPEYSQTDSPTWGEQQLVASQLCGRIQPSGRGNRASADACYARWPLSEWPDGQVVVTRQRVRSRGDSQNRLNPTGPLCLTLTPMANGVDWRGPEGLVLIDGGSQLLATDPGGQIVNRISAGIPLVDNSLNRPLEVRCFRFGHFVAVGAGNRIASLDLRNNTQNGPGPLLWSSEGEFESEYDYEIAALRAWQRRRGIQYESESPSGSTADSRAGELCAAGPLAIVVRNGSTLRAFDPLDGQFLWQRDGMPEAGPAFGDYGLLFLAPTGRPGGIVVSMIDGSTVGTWRRPAAKWLTTAGRNIATLRKNSKGQHLEIVDAQSNEKVLTRRYDRNAGIAEVSPGWIAVMEPSGVAELIHVLAAKVHFQRKLASEPKMESLHVVRDGEILYWGINTLSAAKHTDQGYVAVAGAPLVTGNLYALDVSTGQPLWARPATLDGLGIASRQSPGSPVLLLVSRHRKGPEATATESTRALGLDKRNGRSLLREEGMAALETDGYWIQADRSRGKVALDLERTLLTVEFTATPRPPEPVAQSHIEVAPERKEGSIWGMLGNILVDPPAEEDDD